MSTRLSLLISFLLTAAAGVFTAWVYPRIVKPVPIHFNLAGEADSWADKGTATLFFGCLVLGLLVLFQIIPAISPKNFKIEGFLPTFNVIRVVIVGLFAYIHVLTMWAGTGAAFDPGRAIIGGLMLFMALLGNYMGKVRKNFWIGIRVPWTLASDKNWIATHRLAAWLLVGTGILGAVAAFAGAPLEYVFWSLMAALIVPVFYSLWLFKTGQDRENGQGAGVMALVLGLVLLPALGHSAEREVTFKGVGGLELKGTLTIPDKAEKGKTKAVLMLPGSGPTDRNGNQPPEVMTDLLKTVAERLDKEGVATLRFDKRAALVNAATFPKDLKALSTFFAMDAFLGDAEAALAFLRSQPEVDANKTGVLGHSEGGMYALKLTQRLNAPSFLILMSTCGRTIGDVFYNQMEAGMTRQNFEEGRKNTLLKGLRESLDEFEKTKKIPATMPDEFKMYFPAYIEGYLYEMFFYDPIPAVLGFKRPVLLLQGEKDIQVLKDKDAKALREALGKREGAFQYREIASASHNFKVVKDENKETGFTGPVIPEVLETLAEWIGKV